MLAHRMALVRFRLCRKNLGNLREFLGKWSPPPPPPPPLPGKKLPVRLCVSTFSIKLKIKHKDRNVRKPNGKKEDVSG